MSLSSCSTNKLVAIARQSVVPAGILASIALGAALLTNHNSAHAAIIDSAAPLDEQSISALTSLDRAMEALTARVEPAVVNVAVTSHRSSEESSEESESGQGEGLPPGLQRFFGQAGPQGRKQEQPQVEHGIGSGIVLSPDGYILTNNHVVDGAVNVRVTLNDRRIFSARVVGVDKLTDLAVLKVDAHDLPSIPWGDSTSLKPGQTVLAFGSPFGYFRNSVTRGIVSAVNRANPYSDDPRKPGSFIQTDAAINPGNSGGALVDARGELVGINTFIISSNGSFAGAGFAIPAQIARATAEQIMQHGRVDHGYLGIGMNDVTPENAHFFKLADASGAIVSQVTPDSPASRAGLRQGDVIAQLNGKPIVNGSALQVNVSQSAPGTKITLGILRDGKTMKVDLTVGAYNPEKQAAASEGGAAQPKPGKLGLAVSELTPEARQQLQVPSDVHGVAVEEVRPASPAEDAGLQPGDIILEVDRHRVESASQFVGEIHQGPSDKDVLLLVWSRGSSSYRTLHPAAAGQNG